MSRDQLFFFDIQRQEDETYSDPSSLFLFGVPQSGDSDESWAYGRLGEKISPKG
jgi:hypothetical protein